MPGVTVCGYDGRETERGMLEPVLNAKTVVISVITQHTWYLLLHTVYTGKCKDGGEPTLDFILLPPTSEKNLGLIEKASHDYNKILDENYLFSTFLWFHTPLLLEINF